MLAERKALEAAGKWAAEKNRFGELEPQSDDTRQWLEKASVDFSHCSFFIRKEARIEDAKRERKRVDDSLLVYAERITFSGFVFPGGASFWCATFQAYAHFSNTIFSDYASFSSATFNGGADFQSAKFNGYAFFQKATFSGDAIFAHATFSAYALFLTTNVSGDASFFSATFSGNSRFDDARFRNNAIFKLAGFRKYASFERVTFEGPASFSAIRGDSGFTMAGARFDKVPDFIQAHFEEAPRLDNMKVSSERNSDLAGNEQCARWRALKHLAIQAHDTDRELEFNAQEITAERMAALSSGKAWYGGVRSIASFLYRWTSDYGRSLTLPFAWWGAAIAISASFYLSQTPAVQRDLELKDTTVVFEILRTVGYASSNSVQCFNQDGLELNKSAIGGLIDGFRDTTSARAEALHLAFRNAFIVLDGSSEAAHRTYGCLYGVELYGGSNPVAVVPSAVSTASAVQKLFSALMIFLFGLALRNMLKVK
ncbi:pentapeptide repeat-containing protein [Rhodomicrobium lacus]|uniref:pentapeptide repeat-containing protein n=1 Tax=Rhodomicrobium lacus TaxID=2498452 RepID=UPI0013E07C73|nr:pentapeptide repeat-containing protein [Rhodomicrobium lacus]